MGVPVFRTAGAHIDQFQKADASLRQTPGYKALPAEPGSGARFQSVQPQGLRTFPRQVESLGCGRLHAERGFKGADTGFQRLVGGTAGLVALVQPRQKSQFHFLQGARRCWPSHMGQRVRPRNHMGTLMATGKEIRAPGLSSGVGRLRSKHHERGQVMVQGAQTVADPRAHTGPGELGGTCVRGKRAFVVAVAVGDHGV